MAAVTAQHHGRRAATIEHEDGLVARRGIEAAERRGQWPGQEAALSRRQLRAEIDHDDAGQFAGRAPGKRDATVADRPVRTRRCRRPGSPNRGRRRRPPAGRARGRRRAPAGAASGRSCRPRRAPRRRRRDRHRAVAPGPPGACPRRCPPTRPGSVAIRRRARRHRGPSGRARCARRGPLGADPPGATPSRSPARAVARVGPPPWPRRSPRRRCAVFPPPVTPSSRSGVGSPEAMAVRIVARASAWAGVRSDAGGRPPRRPAGRPASGRLGRSRISEATRPRRTRPASAEAPCRAARSAPGFPGPSGPPVPGVCPASSSRTASWRGPSGRPASRSPARTVAAASRPSVGQRDPAFVPWPRGRGEQRPVQ